MKNEEKRGRLDYSELRTPPEKHELATANYFVNRGKDVSFIRPSSFQEGRKTVREYYL